MEDACRSASNFWRARESSVSKSTEVEEETLRASFFTFGAASRGSGRCRPGGISHTQKQISATALLGYLGLRPAYLNIFRFQVFHRRTPFEVRGGRRCRIHLVWG